MKKDYGKLALEQTKKTKGKLEIRSKVNLESREDLATAYTPGVAAVSRLLAEKPELASQYSIKANSVAVVSDGSAVLGLGNIGPLGALPVMEGKAILFKEFAGVDAYPIVLNTQDPDEIVKTVKNLAPGFGGINLEDIAAPNCFYIEDELQNLGIPVFHDDQHGTAVVVLAALINAAKVVGKEMKNLQVVINGAGAAGQAVAKILLGFGVKELILVDSKGAIYTGRGQLDRNKEKLAQLTNKDRVVGQLDKAIAGKDVFIGVSKAGLLTQGMVRSMNEAPIVFAMANPNPEIEPALAKKAGAVVVGTGRSDFPNQINNVLAFPGIFRGALDRGAKRITKEMKLAAALALAKEVGRPHSEQIVPSPLDKKVAKKVAAAVYKAA
ncbi:MAG: NADP-dependent malic enzyme [bacterium]|nr:NADP-dependent malic enzyme [bacterium]